eukprot:6469207-Prymnesium_polylepis.2
MQREARERGARGRTSARSTTLRGARPRRAASAAGPRRDPASRRAHRAVSGADGLVRVVCSDGRAARAAADTPSAAVKSREQVSRAPPR